MPDPTSQHPPTESGAPLPAPEAEKPPSAEKDTTRASQSLPVDINSLAPEGVPATDQKNARSADPDVRVEPYNADRSRDATRQTITLWLIGLLCGIVSLTFVALFARGISTGFRDGDFFHELKQVLDVLVGPVITLLASAIGFYFGYKQGELGEQVKNMRGPG